MNQYIAPTNLICVTLYNESVDEFRLTLNALIISLQDFDADHPAVNRASSCVCIMADGGEKLSPSIKALLIRCGLWSADVAALTPGTVFHFSSHHPSILLAEIDDRGMAVRPLESPIHFAVCVKPRNRGKFDSHALFFDHLCEQLRPAYCYQLDTGTAVHRDSIRAMVEQLRTQPHLGALASRVVLPAPALGEGLLHSWQFLDFAAQSSYCWQAELASGHLSVMPGQFCAFRWSALCPPKAEPAHGIPVQRYLRGINPATPWEKLMFLSEDRVIGNEIVLDATHHWRLDYCGNSRAVTDHCASMHELLRQRRRWINGSTACRLWLIGRWPAQLLRADRTPADKLHFSAAMLWQLLLIIQQVLAPATTVCMWAVLWSAAMACGPRFATAVIVTAMAAAALEVYAPRNLSPRGIRAYAACRDTAGCGGLVLTCIALTTAHSWLAMLVIMLPTVLAFTAIILGFSRQKSTILRRFPEYWALGPIMQIVLLIYALCRLDDLSWGTKGLTCSHEDEAGAKRMRRLKEALLAGWIAVNIAVIWLGLSNPGLLIPAFNPVVETSQLALLLTIGLSGCLTMKRRWWPPRAVAPRFEETCLSRATHPQGRSHGPATRH
ncbi:MAG: hypothetical protein M3N97_16820 [Pseudomonadota bacterium]|nr:hypothetical protein [Pseudomonadota bacterium]